MTPEEVLEQKRWDAEFLEIADILEHGSVRGVSMMLKGVQVDIVAPTPYGLLEGRKRAREIMLDRVGPRPGRDPGWDLVVYLTEAATLVGIVAAISPAALAAAVPAVKKLVGTLKSSGLAPDLEDLGTGALENLMKFAWTKTLWSGVRSVLWAFAGAVVPALLAALFSPEAAETLKTNIPIVGGVVSLAFIGLGNAALNWWKNRPKQ